VGHGLVGNGSRRELPGLCTGLLGRSPLGASLLTEGIDRGIEGGEEVIRIEWADEFVALKLRSDRILEFGEDEGRATGVEFLVEVSEHVSGSGINVGHWLSGDENPARSWRGPCEAANLVAESAGVREKQWCVEAEDHKSRKFLSFGMLSPIVLARQARDAAKGSVAKRPLLW